jgi:XTP/dITP diphosphohydrolase
LQPILLATRSTDKVREIAAILAPFFSGRIITLDEAGISESAAEDNIEVFDTFIENALAKAEYFATLASLSVIADDSGISVDALGGAPGVRSKRFSGSDLRGTALDYANNDHLLAALRGVQTIQRTAHYTCAAVLRRHAGVISTAVGVRSGFVLEAPRGPHGFGYDPLFLDPRSQLSFGEMDPVLKNNTSHRARAFRALAAQLADPRTPL